MRVVSVQVPRPEASNLRLQRALRGCSASFLADVANAASLVWQVPRSRAQIWSSDVGELLQLYDEQSFRQLADSFCRMDAYHPVRVTPFNIVVARMLAGKILSVINCGRSEYEHCFRCIVLKSAVQQVLSRFSSEW